ncbi:MAG: hypothetical protein ACJ8AO_11820 [Gemmatimonadaceae bacterium]
MRPPRRPLVLLTLALIAAACGDDGASPAHDALGDYVAVGASHTAGFASDGLVFEAQSAAYPVLLGRAGEVTVRVPRVQAPGCVPPLVAPLYLGRTLAGTPAFASVRDTSCLGRFDDSVRAQVVAVPEVTAYAALRFTHDSAFRASDARARRALPEILLAGFTQVQQATIDRPSLVTVELGFTELVRAVRSGRMVAATAETYRADTAFTFVPLDVWQPVYDSVVAALATARRGALLGVPSPTAVPALRGASALDAARDSLRAFGVSLAGDCAGSGNYVYLAKVAAAAAEAARTGTARTVSCADVPGAADSVLTPADVAALASLRDAMNAHIQGAASARGWAYVDVSAALPSAPPSSYSPGAHLTSTSPYGDGTSLDGIHPDASGQAGIATAIANALNALYGLDLIIPVPVQVGAVRRAMP